MQMIVRKGSGIKSVADMKGKTITVGAAGSATELNSVDLFNVYGMDYHNAKEISRRSTRVRRKAQIC